MRPLRTAHFTRADPFYPYFKGCYNHIVLRRMNKLIISFTILFFVTVIYFNLYQDDLFSRLAQSFLQGKTYFLQKPEFPIDTTFFNGRYYWPSGPFPAVILLPFVFIFKIFNLTFYQGYLQPLLVFVVFWLCYKISHKIGYQKNDSLLIAIAFCFSTVFIQVAMRPEAWAFAQVISTLLLLLLIYAAIKKAPLWILGLICGLSASTRLTTLPAILFPLLSLIFVERNHKLQSLVKIFIPFALIIFLIGLYNYIRFGNFLESGYKDSILIYDALINARAYGLFDLVHLPGNLYYFLLSGPIPIFKDNTSPVLEFPFIRANTWGMSIFITSPIFLYLFLLSYRDKLSKILIITTILIAIPIFLYYGIGWRQFGYRYALDFLPLIFFLLIRNYKTRFGRLSQRFKLIILVSMLTNMYFLFSAFIYP